MIIITNDETKKTWSSQRQYVSPLKRVKDTMILALRPTNTLVSQCKQTIETQSKYNSYIENLLNFLLFS